MLPLTASRGEGMRWWLMAATWGACLVASAFGCGARVVVGEQYPQDSGVGDLWVPGPIATSYSAGDVAAARAACNAPHGNIFTPRNWPEYEQHFVGAWYLCSSDPDVGDQSDLPHESVIFT